MPMTTIGDARRNLDERKARTAIVRMRAGNLILQVTHRPGGREWRLSDGTHVTDSVAKRIIVDSCVTPSGDGLFAATPQSWRHVASSF